MVSKTSADAAAGTDSVKPVLANAERHYKVTVDDLPLSCPMPDMSLWNSHPRIYLPIEEDGGKTQCTYCGAHFELVPKPGTGKS